MLVLTRKTQEKVRIGESIVITVLRTKGKAVRLGIEAPGDVPVLRGELIFEESASLDESASLEEAAKEDRSAESQPPADRRELLPGQVYQERVSRDRRAQILPHLVQEGGPLRSMIESRAAS